jgi:hypothetical protein
MIKFKDNLLLLDSSKHVSFKFKIKSIVIYDDIIVVLLDVPSGTILNENVFGVSLSGAVVWQIESAFPADEDSPYVAIEKSDKALNAFNWSGMRMRLIVATGKIVQKKVTK